MPGVCRKNPGGRSIAAVAGFTLLELIIVMVLVGLFMVVSIPALRNTLLDDPLAASGRRLIGYLGSLREVAVREQQGYRLVVDLDENRIWFEPETLLAEETLEPPENLVYAPAGGIRLRTVWQRDSGSVGRGPVEIWLSRQGYLAMTVIQLEDRDGAAISLVLRPFLPEIEVHEGSYEPESNAR